MKNAEITKTESRTKKTGLVEYALLPMIGGKLKSAVLGGTKPAPLPAIWNKLTNTPGHQNEKSMGIRTNPIGSWEKSTNLTSP